MKPVQKDDWLSLKRKDILRRWRSDEIGYGTAINMLVGLGYSVEKANSFLVDDATTESK